MTTKKKTSKKSKKNVKKTYVCIVLDRSGSMSSIHAPTVEGINKQFRALKDAGELGGDTEVSLIQFDDQIDVVFDGQSPNELSYWKHQDFQPRGNTSLYDGIWNAINLLKKKAETEDTGFLVCTISDGGENSSKEITHAILLEEIKRLQATNKWTFTYLLANQDINVAAQTFAAPAGTISTWNNTATGAVATYAVNASSIGTYMGMRNAGGTSTADFYSESDKATLTNTK